MSLFVLFVAAKWAGLEIHGISPFPYLWQDALLALGWLWLLRGAKWAFLVLAFWTAFNIPVVRLLGTPLTWPMLGATGGALADSIALYLTATNLALVAGAGVLAVLLRRTVRDRPAHGVLLLAIVALGPAYADRGLHRNAVVALVATAFPRVAARPATGPWRRARPAGPDLRHLRGAAAGRDVVVVVLESAGAVYLRPYGAREDPMPGLTRLAARGLLFENAYAVYPESVKGFVALLGSRYPAIDVPAERYGALRFATLASALAGAGYDTALVHSGRFDYLGMEHVIRDRGFDVLLDAGAIGGARESSFGVDEEAAVDRMLAWAGARPRGRPYLLAYLPVAGHHPYGSPEEGPFPHGREIDAYRNALHYADRQIARLLAGLGRLGRPEPLVVVVGDHGQAFRQHAGNYGHSFCLYEENVKVPLVVAGAGVDAPVRVGRVASHVDVAPTVLDLLGVPAPAGFQGASLLAPVDRTALLFTDYSLALLGLRDGRFKYVLEVETGREEVFDLARDPGERRPLPAAVAGPLADRFRALVTDWGQAQRARIESGDVRPPPAPRSAALPRSRAGSGRLRRGRVDGARTGPGTGAAGTD